VPRQVGHHGSRVEPPDHVAPKPFVTDQARQQHQFACHPRLPAAKSSGSTVPPDAAGGKPAPARSAVFLVGTVDKSAELGYRAAHGDRPCWSATVFLVPALSSKPTCLSFERA